MSFDSVFDYTEATTAINGKIENYNSNNLNVDVELDALGNVTNDLLYVTEQQSATLNAQKTRNDSGITFLTGVITNITNVGNIASDDKNVIYDFYSTYVSEPKKDFMSRLTIYSAGIITNETTDCGTWYPRWWER